jgi:hypothetical protein
MSNATALEMVGLGIDYEVNGGFAVKMSTYCQSHQFEFPGATLKRTMVH